MQIEGQIIGFDEYMNMTLEDAVEVVGGKRTDIGRILLKGDSISVLNDANPTRPTSQ
jgi:small nuclear ribonucleoprotein E